MVDHLSYSSVNTYLLCPRSWKFRYIDKIATPVSPNLIFGSVFHDTVETLLESNLSEGDTVTNPDVLFRQNWESKLSRENVTWGDDSPDAMLATGQAMLQDKDILSTIRAIVPMVDSSGLIIEKRVNLTVPGVPVPVIGYIDVITQDGVPCDIKTAGRKWSAGQAESELQPLFYLAALNQEGFSLNVDWKFRHYVFTKTKSPVAQVFEVKRKPTEAFWLFGLIADVWRAIDAKVFPPQPNGWKCSEKYCEYWGNCRGA